MKITAKRGWTAQGVLAGLLLVGGAAWAQQGEGRPHRQPPPAAFEACTGKSAADSCTVTVRDHSISGVCQAADDGRLFCRPARPPGPPPEAVEACRDKKAGDGCSVTLGSEALSGTCQSGPDGNAPLACRPSGPPPGAPPEHG
jgi:hypothetical protein